MAPGASLHGVAGSAGTNDHEALPVWRSRLHSAVTLTVVSHPGWHLTTLDVREARVPTQDRRIQSRAPAGPRVKFKGATETETGTGTGGGQLVGRCERQ